jgi:hypothetical protein
VAVDKSWLFAGIIIYKNELNGKILTPRIEMFPSMGLKAVHLET